MAGQAGWYRAPGEEGLLRYWNGSAWTEHRQPVPDAVPAPVETTAEPDWSMDQFEKQFEKQAASDPDRPTVNLEPSLDSRNFDAVDDLASLFATPPAASGISPELAAAPAPTPVQTSVQTSTAIPMPAATVVEPTLVEPTLVEPTLVEPSLHETDGVTVTRPEVQSVPSADPAASVSRFAPEAPLSAALRYAPPPAAESVVPSAEDRATFAAATASVPDEAPAPNPKRGRLVASLRAMVLGFAIILVGAALVFFMAQQPVAPTGQVETLGIVTSLGASNGECTPTARFAAGSGSYTASIATAISPCTFQLGESVSVVYSPANPDSSGRIVVPDLLQEYLWVVSVIGLAVVLVSLLVFVFGAGSLAAGIAIVRDGRPERASRAGKSGAANRRRADGFDTAR